MRRAIGLAGCVGLAFLLSGCPFARQESSPRSLTFGGLERTYRVFVPEGYTGETEAPLVLVLHGGGGGGTRRAEQLGFNDVARAHGFIVAYPEGVGEEWNDGRGVRFRSDESDVAIDDVGFIVQVVDAVAAEFAIDRKRVYVTGPSNGGMMTHRLAIEAAGTFAAAAPVIGTLPAPLRDGATPGAPMPMLMIFGTDDPAVPFDGGYVFDNPNLGEVASVAETVAFWQAANGCAEMPEVIDLPDLDRHDGSSVSLSRYDCMGAPVELYVVEGGGHKWPAGPDSRVRLRGRGINGDINATEVIWEFFNRFSRP